MAPMIIYNFQDIFLFSHFIENPQTTIALTFLIHIISDIGRVSRERKPERIERKFKAQNPDLGHEQELDWPKHPSHRQLVISLALN